MEAAERAAAKAIEAKTPAERARKQVAEEAKNDRIRLFFDRSCYNDQTDGFGFVTRRLLMALKAKEDSLFH